MSMTNKKILQMLMLLSQIPLFFVWFGKMPVSGLSGVAAIYTPWAIFFYYFTGVILYVVLLWCTKHYKLAGICYLSMLLGVFIAFATWPVLTITGEIDLFFSYHMMNWGFVADVVGLILAMILHFAYIVYCESRYGA